MIRFIVGTGLALFALLTAYLVEGGNLPALLGFSAFTITFFLPFFGVLAVWSFRDWAKAWGHAFRPGDPGQTRVSLEIWKFSEFGCYLAGLLGSLIGGILILGNVDWTNSTLVGKAFAASLIAPLYAATFGYVCRILRTRVEALTP